MADRMHSYPMFPQSLTPNSLQQSQIPQQPPPSQQPDPQMISALSNPEHSRMWQQMSALPSQYCTQQPGDLAASQMNHQASIALRVFFSPFQSRLGKSVALRLWDVLSVCDDDPSGQSPFPSIAPYMYHLITDEYAGCAPRARPMPYLAEN